LDFLDFRDHLSPASGFQSHQFRKLEVMLGLKIKQRHQLGGCPYHSQFEGDKKQEILNLEESDSLFTLAEKWLERIPFLNMEAFDFTKKYEGAVNEMLAKEIAGIKSANLTEEDRALRTRMIDENRKYFDRVLKE
jgi:tryptophan 2,3-dioxygenase